MTPPPDKGEVTPNSLLQEIRSRLAGTEGQNSLLLEILNRLAITEAQNSQIIAAQGRAEEGRKAIYDELRKFALVSSTVARIEPIVEGLERVRIEAVGASKVAGAITKAVYAIVGAAIATLGWLASAFMGGTPMRH